MLNFDFLMASILIGEAVPGTLPEGPDLTRYLLICGMLIGVIALVGWGFRRLFSRTLRVKAAKRSMQVMDVLPLGGKHRLAVVRCYDRTFLLGMGERELSLLSELDGVIQPNELPTPGTPEREDFSRTVDRLLRRGAAPVSSVSPGAAGAMPEKRRELEQPRQAQPVRQARPVTLQPGGILG